MCVCGDDRVSCVVTGAPWILMVLVGGRSPALGVFGVGVVGGTTAASVVVEARLRAPSLRRVDRPRGAARRSRLGLTAERRVRAIYRLPHSCPLPTLARRVHHSRSLGHFRA